MAKPINDNRYSDIVLTADLGNGPENASVIRQEGVTSYKVQTDSGLIGKVKLVYAYFPEDIFVGQASSFLYTVDGEEWIVKRITQGKAICWDYSNDLRKVQWHVGPADDTFLSFTRP